MKNPFISVIIANYNGENYLPLCLTSVLKTNYAPFEVIVIDDGSQDTSRKIIQKFQKKDKRIYFEKNSKNRGAAASRNSAVKSANGSIFVFLDNDTEVDMNWLAEIAETFSKDRSVGGTQSLLMDFEKRGIIQMAGATLWAQTAWGLPIGQWQKKSKKFSSRQEIIAISASLAVRKDVFETVGGFDEDEAVVTEDLDLSWRIWIAGYKIVLSPRSIVYHWTKNVTMRKNMKHSSKVIYFHLTKNSLISILKNYETQNVIQYFFTSLGISLGRGILALYVRHDFSPIASTMKAFMYVFGNIPKILMKRKQIQTFRKTTDRELFHSVIVKEGVLSIYKKYFRQTGLL